MKIFQIYVLLMLPLVCGAQIEATQRLISPAGGQGNAGGINVSWTVGEVAVFSSNLYGQGMQSYPIFLKQRIDADFVPDKGLGDPPFVLNAAALFGANATGLPVTLTTSTPSTISISGNTVTIEGNVGTAQIKATVPGNGIFLPADTTINFQITLAACPGGSPQVPVITAPNNALCTGTGYLLTAQGPGYTKYQWYLDNFLLVNDTLATYDPVSNGAYKVKVFHSLNSCTSESAPFTVELGSGVVKPTLSASGDPTNKLTATGGGEFKWYVYNRMIVNETAGELDVRYNGNYFVESKYENGCILRSDPFSVNSTSYIDILRADVIFNDSAIYIPDQLYGPFSHFKATPNPFESELNISYFSSVQKQAKIELYNVSGIKVMQTGLIPGEDGYKTSSFDTRQLATGIYLLKATEGNEVKVVKLIKLK